VYTFLPFDMICQAVRIYTVLTLYMAVTNYPLITGLAIRLMHFKV